MLCKHLLIQFSPDRKGIVRCSSMPVATQAALQAGGGQGEPDPGRQETPQGNLQVSLHPIVAQHFFIILISYLYFLDPFLAVLHQPGISCQPLWQGNVLSQGLPHLGNSTVQKKSREPCSRHCPPPPCFLSHVTTSLLPVNQSQKISGVQATALKVPCGYSARS